MVSGVEGHVYRCAMPRMYYPILPLFVLLCDDLNGRCQFLSPVSCPQSLMTRLLWWIVHLTRYSHEMFTFVHSLGPKGRLVLSDLSTCFQGCVHPCSFFLLFFFFFSFFFLLFPSLFCATCCTIYDDCIVLILVLSSVVLVLLQEGSSGGNSCCAGGDGGDASSIGIGSGDVLRMLVLVVVMSCSGRNC
jgi:hypothetical protein